MALKRGEFWLEDWRSETLLFKKKAFYEDRCGIFNSDLGYGDGTSLASKMGNGTYGLIFFGGQHLDEWILAMWFGSLWGNKTPPYSCFSPRRP
jgi:hypothetical protein